MSSTLKTMLHSTVRIRTFWNLDHADSLLTVPVQNDRLDILVSMLYCANIYRAGHIKMFIPLSCPLERINLFRDICHTRRTVPHIRLIQYSIFFQLQLILSRNMWIQRCASSPLIFLRFMSRMLRLYIIPYVVRSKTQLHLIRLFFLRALAK